MLEGKCCGTCEYFIVSLTPYGNCKCPAPKWTMRGTTNNEMNMFYGTDCPCYEVKEAICKSVKS